MTTYVLKNNNFSQKSRCVEFLRQNNTEVFYEVGPVMRTSWNDKFFKRHKYEKMKSDNDKTKQPSLGNLDR